jgi:hypothetical protein
MRDDWDIMDDLVDGFEERPNNRGSNFNKEKFCKKNKLGGGQYGPHTYVNGGCTLCSKIDPRVKFGSNKE